MSTAPLTRSQRRGALTELASLLGRGRSLEGALAQLGRASEGPVASEAQSALLALRRGARTSRALASFGPFPAPYDWMLDQGREPSRQAEYLTHALEAMASQQRAQDRWFSAVVWPVVVLLGNALVTPWVGWVRLGSAPSTTPWLWLWAAVSLALALGAPPMLRRYPSPLRFWPHVGTLTRLGVEATFWRLATVVLRDGGAPRQSIERAAHLAGHVTLRQGVKSLPPSVHWSDALTHLSPPERRSLKTASDVDVAVERIERIIGAETERRDALQAALCRQMATLLTGLALVVSVWSGLHELQRFANARLPDGRILNPERLESLIETEVPRPRRQR